MYYKILAILLITSVSCSNGSESANQTDRVTVPVSYSEKTDTATVAGGCFWCVEASYEQIEGVIEAVSGYAGGSTKNPTYQQVGTGRTGHTETVQVYYDPEIIDFRTIVEIFFTSHDPTQLNRQGPDVGTQYRSAAFYHNEEQKRIIESVIDSLNANVYNGNIVTEVVPYTEFWMAEDYHQDYEEKHPDNPYVVNVSKPKIKRVARVFSDRLKEEYK